MSTSSKRKPSKVGVVVSSLLLGVLCIAFYYQMRRLISSPQPAPEIYLGLALWLSLLLACVCWWIMLGLSRAHADALGALQAQSERREQEELKLAAEAMQHYAIFMLDPKGYVASWDRDAERLMGYTIDDVMARHVSIFYGDDDARQGKPAHDLRVATTEGRADDDRWMVRKDGFRFRASVALVAIRDPAGDLCGFTNVIREEVSVSSP